MHIDYLGSINKTALKILSTYQLLKISIKLIIARNRKQFMNISNRLVTITSLRLNNHEIIDYQISSHAMLKSDSTTCLKIWVCDRPKSVRNWARTESTTDWTLFTTNNWACAAVYCYEIWVHDIVKSQSTTDLNLS